MAKKSKVDYPELLDEKEFSAEADRLLEYIYQFFKRRDNRDLTHEEAVEIATYILESR